MKKYLSWLIPIVVGLIIWFSPTPEGLKPQAWHLFAIFAGTIFRLHFTTVTDWCAFDY